MPTFRTWAAAFLCSLAVILPSFAEAAATTPDDTVVVAQAGAPVSLDPQAATTTADFRILVNLFDGLVRFKSETMEVEPALAKSWTIAPDGLTYTFDLRSGVKFQDGTPFNADAVVFTFERMLDPEHPFHSTGPFPLSFVFASVERVRAVGPDKVEFRLREPFAPLLSNLATPTGFIVSPEAVKKYGKDIGRHPVGTGAFAVADWSADGTVSLTRNETYWDGGAKTAKAAFQPIPDAAARVSALRSGALDVAADLSPADLKPVADTAGIDSASATAPHLWFLILNTRHGPFSDKRVRQAVNYAIDKKKLVETVLGGGAEIAAGPIPSAFGWASDPAVKPYPYDPEKARQLIREAGAEGATLTFYVAESGAGMLDPVAMASAIQADLKAVNLDVRIETYEWNTFLSNVNPGLGDKADMAEMAWTTSDPDTLPYLALRSGATPEDGGFNSGRYANPEVDKRLDAAHRAVSQEERAQLYKQVQKLVHEDAPWAFIAHWKQQAATAPGVEGLRLEPTFLFRLKDVSKS
ncbi:ABC transporter substrate-binding protein [Mangrovicella endophytica]|uniref:ABC transporter substrate-binding protein n=1 Tax=Mangrovicella endophytica TaxID=2066697 RepID=UPI000C9E1750|nr:ABC transporter substrate-binding protein [Mangrovicella endophytica]